VFKFLHSEVIHKKFSVGRIPPFSQLKWCAPEGVTFLVIPKDDLIGPPRIRIRSYEQWAWKQIVSWTNLHRALREGNTTWGKMQPAY